jgi:hypothetical protein
MSKNLLLIDYENVHKIDLSDLDDSYRAIIFVGAQQNPPKAASKKATAHRFARVDFHKIEGNGKNALDFHIAFHLGRTFETAPDTSCIVLSKDKGFDPLLSHLNKNGLRCRRVNSIEELLPEPIERVIGPEEVFCQRCNKVSTIEHNGGRWCSNCGAFASPPDPLQLPSNRPSYFAGSMRDERGRDSLPECGWCHQKSDMSDGIYDDGEWMCGACIASYAR